MAVIKIMLLYIRIHSFLTILHITVLHSTGCTVHQVKTCRYPATNIRKIQDWLQGQVAIF